MTRRLCPLRKGRRCGEGAERVRVAARAGRFGLHVALLLVLFGVSVAVAPGAGNGVGAADVEPPRVSVTGESMSATPPMHDDVQDWLRLTEGTLPASATAPPDIWAVCPRPTGECVLPGRSLIDEVGGHGMAVTSPAPRSSRAPPLA